MSIRYHAVGTLLAALILFFWGGFTHIVLFEALDGITILKMQNSAVTSLQKTMPDNGTYMTEDGVLVVVNRNPDMPNVTEGPAMTGPLIRQFVIDLVIAVLLSFVVLQLTSASAHSRGRFLAVIALAAAFGTYIPQWSWYGFGGVPTLLGMLDLVGGWFLAGWVLAWLARRWVAVPAEAAG